MRIRPYRLRKWEADQTQREGEETWRESHRKRRTTWSVCASLSMLADIAGKRNIPGRIRLSRHLFSVFVAITTCAMPALAQSAPVPTPQNPSPMVENSRAHERLVQRPLAGIARSFLGPANRQVEILVPTGVRSNAFDVVIHFHGAAWLAQRAVAALDNRTVTAVLNLGTGSGVYDRSFADPAVFDSLLLGVAREVTATTGHSAQVGRVTLTGWSAGHGAIRAILRDPRHFAAVHAVLLMDGMHTSYVPEGTPLAVGSAIDTTNLVAFTEFARAAMRGDKRFLVTHSEIFPGTFVSTTETADWLLNALHVRRTPVLRWGPRGLQQLSEARAGRFTLLGYAGNSAPDHIDQLHAMPELLARLLKH